MIRESSGVRRKNIKSILTLGMSYKLCFCVWDLSSDSISLPPAPRKSHYLTEILKPSLCVC